MCKETFLRLPEEKRTRILNAAWEEFTTVSFTNASINRIVRGAGIPRGSFYQYFEDKSDLFHYLMTQIHDQLIAYSNQLLLDAGGNLFRAALTGYGRFIAEQKKGTEIPVFERCVSLVRINPGMDLESLGRLHRPDKAQIAQSFLKNMDLTPFRRQDSAFLMELCCMVGMCVIGTLMDCLMNPEQEAEHSQELVEALDILRRGSYSEEALRDAETITEEVLRDAGTMKGGAT